MTLAGWLRKTKTTQLEFAEMSGVPQPLVSRYASGKGHPKAHYILAIEKATNGEVALEDWARDEAKRAAG